MSFHLNLIAEYRNLFPESNENVSELSKGIPKKLIVLAATTFLGMDTFKKEHADWRETLKYWFLESNGVFANNVSKRFIEYYEKIGEIPSIFSPISNLKLLQLGLSLDNDETVIQKTEEQIEIDLFKIYLLLNQSVSEKYLQGKKYIFDTYPDNQPPLLLLSLGFAVSDLINYSSNNEFYCQTIKAFFLFDFLANHKSFQYVSNKFCEYYNIEILNEYYLGLLPLIQAISMKKQDGFFEFNIPVDINYEKNHSFISKLSMQNYNPEDDIDYKEIRSQPFVQVEMNKYRITHPIFFADKIYKGIFFNLSKFNSEAPGGQKIKEFRSYYCKEFSEKYLFYEIMNYAFKKRCIQFSGEDFEKMKFDGGPDYYIRCSSNIFLFENKDALINASIKENSNFEELEKEFKKKFLEDGKSPKAVKQLANTISSIINEKNTFDNNYKVRNVKIYPVLILHDIMFDSAGFNYLLNLWFIEEIDELKKLEKSMPIIKPLIVLTIDVLIQIADALRNSQITIKEVFDNYYKRSTLDFTKQFKSLEDFKNKFASTYLPASVQIENWKRETFPKSHYRGNFFKYAFSKIE